MLLAPMLYTDASDAWRLRSRRKRMAIDVAGIAVETAIACIATFAWAFLPEGHLKSLSFALATTSWFLCLGLNLNPFMRFDGYYLLADATGMENLQARSFAFGRWKLRELLFNLGHLPPELTSRRRRNWLVIYAWAVWIYRLVLFTGIALLVYHFAFKLLGIALFLVEIIYFIAGPVWSEIKEWHKMRADIAARRRGSIVLGSTVAVFGMVCMPLSTTISVPAIIEDREVESKHARRPSYVVAAMVRQGERVTAGELMVELAAPDLEHEIKQTKLRQSLVRLRLDRRSTDLIDR